MILALQRKFHQAPTFCCFTSSNLAIFLTTGQTIRMEEPYNDYEDYFAADVCDYDDTVFNKTNFIINDNKLREYLLKMLHTPHNHEVANACSMATEKAQTLADEMVPHVVSALITAVGNPIINDETAMSILETTLQSAVQKSIHKCNAHAGL
jgi:hypothetical protein